MLKPRASNLPNHHAIKYQNDIAFIRRAWRTRTNRLRCETDMMLIHHPTKHLRPTKQCVYANKATHPLSDVTHALWAFCSSSTVTRTFLRVTNFIVSHQWPVIHSIVHDKPLNSVVEYKEEEDESETNGNSTLQQQLTQIIRLLQVDSNSMTSELQY
jgi:hypothetical protein